MLDKERFAIVTPRYSHQTESASTPEVIWRGSLAHHVMHPVSALMWPFAAAKRTIESMYDAITQALFAELVHGERNDDSVSSFIGLGVIAVFSVVLYQTRDFEDAIILGLCALWLVDRILAIGQYETATRHRPVVVSLCNKTLQWRSSAPGETPVRELFHPSEIDHIALERQKVVLGAFDIEVGYRWRGTLMIRGGEGLLLFEANDLGSAWRNAQTAAQAFSTNIKILDATGESELASDQRFNRARYALERVNTFQTRRVTGGTQITKSIRGGRPVTLIAKVAKEAGFPLFLLLIYFMLIRIGGLLSALLSKVVPIPYEVVVIDLSPAGIACFFLPDLSDPLRILEFAGVMVFIGFKAWRVSQPLTLRLGAACIKVFRGRKAIGALESDSLKAIVAVEAPTPCLIFLGDRRAIEVDGLDDINETRQLLSTLLTLTDKVDNRVPSQRREAA